jgi:hypothetical protein
VSRPAVQPTKPPGALSSEVKRLERESDDSSASSAEVKNERSYTSDPAYGYATMVCGGTVRASNFYLFSSTVFVRFVTNNMDGHFV